MDRVIIFGCGPTGLRTYEELKNNNEILAFLDNDKEKTGSKIEELMVYEPSREQLSKLSYDYIMIASVYGKYEIRKQLRELGVADDKIRDRSVSPNILIPFLENLSEDFKEENISGACAEVGVFRGDNAMIINEYFPDRELHLYDTFEGFSAKDIEIELRIGRKDAKQGQFSDTSVDVVMENMKHPEQVVIHQGYFPDTAQGLDKKFCFVRIDLDLYAPTKAALDIFEPLMVRGGIILVHDYFGNHYPGIKRTVREFMLKHPNLHKMPIGDTMTIAIGGF